MPRNQTFICSGVCFLICSVITAQSLPNNPTVQQVVGYHQYQIKQWNYNQLPKKSVQYRLDPKYIPLTDRKTSSTKLNIHPVATPEIKKSFSKSSPFLQIPLNTTLQGTSYPIPTLSWDGHMGTYIFIQKQSQFEKFQKLKNKSPISEKLFFK